jgi:hypothetical protein
MPRQSYPEGERAQMSKRGMFLTFDELIKE